MTQEELAEKLGLELEQRIVVLTLKLPPQAWEILDKAEEGTGISTQSYLSNLLSRAVADKLLNLFAEARNTLSTMEAN